MQTWIDVTSVQSLSAQFKERGLCKKGKYRKQLGSLSTALNYWLLRIKGHTIMNWANHCNADEKKKVSFDQSMGRNTFCNCRTKASQQARKNTNHPNRGFNSFGFVIIVTICVILTFVFKFSYFKLVLRPGLLVCIQFLFCK